MSKVYSTPQLNFPKRYIDGLIIILLFLVLPIDMLNGIMLKSGINLPVSISQFFKSFIILFIFIRLLTFPSLEVLLLIGIFLLFLIPSFIQYILKEDYDLAILLGDIIKTSKYLTPFLAFVFFKKLFTTSKNNYFKLIQYWIYFSYSIFAFNILLKYAGLGFPMYTYENTGTKGFFYSGNEISALFLVLYSFIAYKLWEIEKKSLFYFLFFIFNMVIGITITSKTAMLGIVLITLLIPLSFRNIIYISFNKIAILLITLIIIIPVSIYLAYNLLSDSLIMERFIYFYGKLDPVTFIFSGRNIKAMEMFEIYSKEYSLIEKLIGGGQYYYENKLKSVIEIDILDIFFAYGALGVFIFFMILTSLLYSGIYRSFDKNYPYGKLSFVMILTLIFTSSIAGHVFNSGIAGLYIGFIFSLMFFKFPYVKENKYSL